MVGLIDCDNFFCSCERVFRPDLARVPLVVLSNNDGCVVARSAEVKAMGIPEGMPYFELRQRHPDEKALVAFSSNYALYADMSARVMAVLRELAGAGRVLQYSIDEAFIDLHGIPPGELHGWGQRLCATVERHTGMPVSLGIAPSSTLAKMASKFAKRYRGYGKCCVIATEQQRLKALELVAATDVWGIGRRIGRTLSYYGVTTAADFAARPRGWVRSHFHVTGERTWRELHGESVIAVDGLDAVEKKSIVTSRSFPEMLTTRQALEAHVANYAARCAQKLRRQGSVCSCLTLFMHSNPFREDLPQWGGQATHAFLTPTASTPELVDAALRLLGALFRPGISYKRAGCMVSGITSGEAYQPDLFTYDAERRRRHEALCRALDAINGRMGADTLVMGAQQYRDPAAGASLRAKGPTFVNAIRRSLKSPDYTTRLGAFRV